MDFPVNIMKNLDSKLVKFYHTVLRLELEKDKIYADAFRKVRNAYRKETISSGKSDICFSSPATRCAYVFLYCAIFGSTTAYHFLQLLKCDTKLFQSITFEDTFHLCCLGGGPGTEIAAIAKILDCVINNYSTTRRKPLLIKATVVDIDSGWSVTAANLVECLPMLVNASLIRCELNFIEADLTEPLPEKVRDTIGEADMVTMSKLLSSINGTRSRVRTDQMLQEVIACIKEGGRLFFVDSASNMHFDIFRNAMESSPDMSESYGPLTHDLYKMSIYSVAKNVKLVDEYFGWQLPSVLTTNYVSFWYKGRIRNPSMRPTLTTNAKRDVEALQKKMQKHFSKCLKFSSSKPREMDECFQQYPLEEEKMFSSKSKIKRIEMKINVNPK